MRGATRSSLTVSGAAGGGGGTSTNTRAASQAMRSGSSGNPRAGFRIRLQAAASQAHGQRSQTTRNRRSAALWSNALRRAHRGRPREGVPNVILPKVRDPRFVTIRRGGGLTDSDHHALALWAASCAEHVLDLFESAQPGDLRPREAIEHARAWVRGEVKMMRARRAAGDAQAAARDLRGAPRYAAYAAAQAAVVAHVAAHELGAAAYAIKAVHAAAPEGEREAAGRLECRWQRDQLPEAIGELVLDDQRLRNEICWSVFDC